MTISATYSPAQASGNGATVAFPFTFKTFAAADLVVIITDANDVDTTQTITTHYSVSLNADQNNNPGGTVTMVTAPASGTTLTIAREIDALQETDIANGGGFYPEVLEDALDRLTMLSQQNADSIERSLTIPVTVAGVSTALPVPEALSIIGWNASGTALENYGAESLVGAIAAIDWVTDIFDGDAATTIFALARDPGVASNCDVAISGMTQTPGVDFTVTTTSIVFTSAPATGTGNVVVRHGSALPSAALVPTDGVATASIQDNAVTTAKIADDNVTVAKIADVELKALAGLTSAANKVPMFSGSGTATLLDFKDEDDMASDSATAVPSQQSVKAFVQSSIAAQALTLIETASPTGVSSDTISGIPATAKHIVVVGAGLSSSSAGSNIFIRLGDSGGSENSGYSGVAMNSAAGTSANSTEFLLDAATRAAAGTWRFTAHLYLVDSATNTWSFSAQTYTSDAGQIMWSQGDKATSGTLDRVELGMTVGNIDAGTWSVYSE